MQAWVESFVKEIVSTPEAVSISLSQGIKTIVFHIAVGKEDLATFRRNQKRLIKALTRVAGLAGAQDRMRYIIKVSG